MNILEKIIETKKREVSEANAVLSFKDIKEKAQKSVRKTVSFSGSLLESETGIIAEFKRMSPSKGVINQVSDVADTVSAYQKAGAAAVSILTDRDYFGGGLDDLEKGRQVLSIPVLRKDFIIDPYQICEARIAGADVILLIAAALTPEKTYELASFAHSLQLQVLLEVHCVNELMHNNEYVDVVGVNNRDLTTFVTDIAVSKAVAEKLPSDKVLISESGISSVDAIRVLRDFGYKGFLMGENFMKTDNPGQALDRFIKELRYAD